MPPTHTIKQGDTVPPLTFTLTGADGVAQDLTGAIVRLSLRNKARSLVVNRAVCTVDDASAGQGHYDWSPTDTANAGTLKGELEVTFADASVLTFPNDGDIYVLVAPQIA